MKEDKKIRVLLAAEREDEICQLLSSMLRKKFVVEELYLQIFFEKPPFLLKRWFLVVKKFRKLLRQFNPNKIVVFGKSLISVWIIVFLIRLLRLRIEIILFRYDIEHFRPYFKNIKMDIAHFVAKKLEKFCLLNSDKIIHKGAENELKFLLFYNKIENKPHYLFREFLNPDLIQGYNPNNKLSKKDGAIHLVSVGAIPIEKRPYAYSIWELYPKITAQKIHFHVYMYVDKKTENKLRKIESENPFFHYEGYLSHKKLIKELTRYDYGTYLTGWNRAKIKNSYFTIVAIGSRIFDYISAHLPIICSGDDVETVKLLDKYGIGFYISPEKYGMLKSLVIKNKTNYYKMIKNTDNAISELIEYKNFIEFIKA